MPRLFIDEEGKTVVYEIFEDEVAIGRGAANAVQLRDPRAAKHHALVRRIGDRWKLIDLETASGTRVNGAYHNQAWLEPGDAIAVGAAVVRFDPEAAVPVAPAAAPPAAVARPVPPVATPPPLPAPRPAPAPARMRRAAPVSRPTAVRRPATVRRPGGARRAREEVYEGEEGRERGRGRRRSGHSAPIVLLGGLGALLFIVVMFLLMQGGTTVNQDVLVKADRMANRQGRYAEAIQYVRTYGERGAQGWTRLQQRIEVWERILELEQTNQRDAEADVWLRKNVILRTETTGFRPKNEVRLPDEEVVNRLRQFLREYGDTNSAQILVAPQKDERGRATLAAGEPWMTFQRLLMDFRSKDADVEGLLAATRGQAQAKVA
ncbi:MAG: FHA domain-containing protein, partial [Planctomycetota bacterium]